MTSDLSATALRDTVARVQKTLGDCDNHADLVCSSGDHHVDVDDLRALLTALARLQEERDRLTAELRTVRLLGFEAGALAAGMGRQWARERAVSYADDFNGP